MTNSFLLEYIVRTKSLIRIQNLLKSLCEIDLNLLDQDGEPIQLSFLDDHKTHLDANFFTRRKQGLTISSSIREKISQTKQTESFIDSSGFKKILIPIIYNDQVIGYLLTGENENFNLTKQQLHEVKAFLEESLKDIIDLQLKFYKNFKGNKETHQQKVVNKAKKYIENNYNHPDLSLDKVSKVNGVSYHYLSRLFKKELKTSFSSYLSNIRIEVASRLLKDRSLTISEVSYSCGFEDPGYFSKVFKRSVGKSPASYRNNILN